MTTYYLLIVAGPIVGPFSTFFKVSVGKTKKDTDALQKLQFIANAKGWYLQKFDLEATLFYRKIAESLGKKVWQVALHQAQVVTMISHLGSLQCQTPGDTTSGNMSHLRFYIDTRFRLEQKKSVLR